ncbi:endoplasmic reticulum vesicle transporter-domain-containing protein [Gilbertella persicaria]|uniref:endoplasmic reticulum vesicle transporter-domain-containing protein n=1 Tax=Gilbertella persicaria TaxID=101096 RepID=UPI0022209476|nr:endoplasmic reticulum vesicle transporter-domain-containing protein [Gilbertella persicaria]KAI8087053.1 endoplasmic reticulum vesicle transporter-domain-containing protein [Gilbertella persicaria]
MLLRKLADRAAAIDAFPKTEDDNQQRSEKGGLLTVLVALCLCFLALSEFSDYQKIYTNYKFIVDSTIDTKMQINIDVTIAMPCPSLMVHVVDATGQRTRLTDALRLIPAEFSTGTATRDKKVEDPRYIHEIIQAASGKKYSHEVANDMGACRVYGSLNVNKVASNLHITSDGHGYARVAHTSHDLLNFTHRIDEFSFGQFYPDLVNPLDNSMEISDSHFEVFQYAISVVPTTYIDYQKNVLLTNQYAVIDSHKTFQEGQTIPGIFFRYDIEPISVQISEARQQSFLHFIVRLCGIIGGSAVTVGALYRLCNFIITGGKEDPKLYTATQGMMRDV